LNKKHQDSTEDRIQSTGRYELPPDFDPDTPTREVILAGLREDADGLTMQALAKKLGLGKEITVGFERRVRAMERDGQLLISPEGKIRKNNQTGFYRRQSVGPSRRLWFLAARRWAARSVLVASRNGQSVARRPRYGAYRR